MTNPISEMVVERLKGGAGSGNFGHSGRPGKVGGSASGGIRLGLSRTQAHSQGRGAAARLNRLFVPSVSSGEIKDSVCQEIATRADVDYDTVNRILKEWARTCRSGESLEFAQCAAEELGIPLSDFERRRYEKLEDEIKGVPQEISRKIEQIEQDISKSEAIIKHIEEKGIAKAVQELAPATGRFDFETTTWENMDVFVKREIVARVYQALWRKGGVADMRAYGDLFPQDFQQFYHALTALGGSRQVLARLQTDLVTAKGNAENFSSFTRVPREQLKRVARAMYDVTQERLRAAGITQIWLYRGIAYAVPIGLPPSGENGFTYKGRSIESWATKKASADRFGSLTVCQLIPAANVFCTAMTGLGCRDEYEVVVMGSKTEMVYTAPRPGEKFKGGEGSGNFGHSGRPGKVGGSSPSGVHQGLGDSIFDNIAPAKQEPFYLISEDGEDEDIRVGTEVTNNRGWDDGSVVIVDNTPDGIKALHRDFRSYWIAPTDELVSSLAAGTHTMTIARAVLDGLIPDASMEEKRLAKEVLNQGSLESERMEEAGMSRGWIKVALPAVLTSYTTIAVPEINTGWLRRVQEHISENRIPYPRKVSIVSPGGHIGFFGMNELMSANYMYPGKSQGWHQTEIVLKELSTTKGGAGSGNWGHAGRPGEVGGSAPQGGINRGLSMAQARQRGLAGATALNKLFGTSSSNGKIKDGVCQEISTRTGIEYGIVNEVLAQWAMSTHSDVSLDFSRCAAEELGITRSDYEKQLYGIRRSVIDSRPGELQRGIDSINSLIGEGEALAREYEEGGIIKEALALMPELRDEVDGNLEDLPDDAKLAIAKRISFALYTLKVPQPTGKFSKKDFMDYYDTQRTIRENKNRLRASFGYQTELEEAQKRAASPTLSGLQERHLKKIARAMYDVTQRKLKEAGINEIFLYRGIGLMVTVNMYQQGMTNTFSYKGRSLESWSTKKTQAKKFGQHTVCQSIPASNVFCTALTGVGCREEAEVVVMGSRVKQVYVTDFKGEVSEETGQINP